eukprot:tig00020746_g13666.t1
MDPDVHSENDVRHVHTDDVHVCTRSSFRCDHLREYIKDLPQYQSPLLADMSSRCSTNVHGGKICPYFFVPDDSLVEYGAPRPRSARFDHIIHQNDVDYKCREMVRAGPRSQIVFQPSEVKAAIVTCGGLCPGLNVVIREIVMSLTHNYGVTHIEGIQYGYRGFYDESCPPVPLTPRSRNFYNGVGVVNLMGRSAGFIAMHATLAARDVNLCLIPEAPRTPLQPFSPTMILVPSPQVKFWLDGPGGVLPYIFDVVRRQGSAVVVCAEGAGQDLLPPVNETDASGNPKLAKIGLFLVDEIKGYFKKKGVESNVKYVDPGYMIRSTPANSSDSLYCTVLARNATHAAFAGYTGATCGKVNQRHVLLPMEAVITSAQVRPCSRMWYRVLLSTLQPDHYHHAKLEDHEAQLQVAAPAKEATSAGPGADADSKAAGAGAAAAQQKTVDVAGAGGAIPGAVPVPARPEA